MQRARSAVVLVACLVYACGGGTFREPSPPPSTAGHHDVAGRDDAPPPPPTSDDGGAPAAGRGNLRIRSFDEAKKALLQIYVSAPTRTDLYCGCPFVPGPGRGLRVDLAACGYTPARDPARAARIEWEHAVPASVFGRTFREWREGDDRCVDGRGRPYHGRRCARRVPEFSRIEADLHNLFPVVGEVNGLRSDLPMGVLDPPERAAAHDERRDTFRFGACRTAIESGALSPRDEIRGDLARAYKYMAAAYPERAPIDDAHRSLFDRWDHDDPPDAWEKERNRLIAERQGNPNPFIGDAP